MSATPIVLIPADHRVIDQTIWHMTPQQYSEAVLVGAGAIPLLLPPFWAALDLESLLDRVDGVLLSGSKSNVHPRHYGVEPDPSYEPYDESRDATTLPLIRLALKRGVPLFAICRGYQELNVALGGTLHTEIQEFEGRFDHRAPVAPLNDERFGLRHPVTVVAGGCIGRILGDGDVTVNSLHRQAIGALSPQLTIEAVAADGTIEAVSVSDAKGFAVGVQWHPEYWVRSDAPSSKLFAAFGDAVRAYADARQRHARAAAE